jgi:hypothetical protein
MTNAYREFFKGSQAGEDFVAKLNQLIDSNHKKGEDEPEMARDYMQRAKGIREVLNQVNALCVVTKKQLQADAAPQD